MALGGRLSSPAMWISPLDSHSMTSRTASEERERQKEMGGERKKGKERNREGGKGRGR